MKQKNRKLKVIGERKIKKNSKKKQIEKKKERRK